MIQKTLKQLPIFSLIILSICVLSCSKGKTPSANLTVNTLYVNPADLSKTSIRYGGEIISDGAEVIDRGVCWSSTDSLPTSADNVKSNGSGIGRFDDSIVNLSPGTKYYVRAFAKSTTSTFYGEVIEVFTNLHITGLSISSSSVYTDRIWTCHAVIYFGLAYESYAPFHDMINTTKIGFCYSSSQTTPTVNDSTIEYPYWSVNTNMATSFDSWLKPSIRPTINKTYYIRAYAYNSLDTVYGTTIPISTGSFETGLYYGGGVIFSVDASGQHGLIASLENQSNSIIWSNWYGWTHAQSVDDGATNTNLIISAQGFGNDAASICRNYRGGGYTDWFLPALNQVGAMNYSGIVPNFPGVIPQVGNLIVWSSTERSNGDVFAHYYARGLSGNILINASMYAKNTKAIVRAIRAF